MHPAAARSATRAPRRPAATAAGPRRSRSGARESASRSRHLHAARLREVSAELQPVPFEAETLVELVHSGPRGAARRNQLVTTGLTRGGQDLVDERCRKPTAT